VELPHYDTSAGDILNWMGHGLSYGQILVNGRRLQDIINEQADLLDDIATLSDPTSSDPTSDMGAEVALEKIRELNRTEITEENLAEIKAEMEAAQKDISVEPSGFEIAERGKRHLRGWGG
jgi:hypothetical protein